MHCRALVSKFTHIAQHEDAGGWQFGKYRDGSFNGVGVGVVSVIDDGGRIVAPIGLQPPRDAVKRFQPGLDGSKWHTKRDGTRCRCERVALVVTARYIELYIDFVALPADGQGVIAEI